MDRRCILKVKGTGIRGGCGGVWKEAGAKENSFDLSRETVGRQVWGLQEQGVQVFCKRQDSCGARGLPAGQMKPDFREEVTVGETASQGNI